MQPSLFRYVNPDPVLPPDERPTEPVLDELTCGRRLVLLYWGHTP